MPQDYESLYIIKADLSDEEIEKETEAVTKLVETEGGSIIDQSGWGKKRLAYAIKKQRYGFFALLRFSADQKIPEKLTRHFRFNENILKGMVVIYDGAAGRVVEAQKPEPQDKSEPATPATDDNDNNSRENSGQASEGASSNG